MPHDYLDGVIGPDVVEVVDWRKPLIRGSKDQVLSVYANVILPLRYDPAWAGVIGFDRMRNAVMALKPLPCAELMRAPEEDDYPRLWTHSDDLLTREWLEMTDFRRVSMEIVSNAVGAVARENAYHPVLRYLDGLRHDGVPRIEGGSTSGGDTVEPWLTRYLGAEDNRYTRAVGKVLLLSMIARVRKPGCKVDTVPILEGPQGAGKSSACRILGGAWFSDALPDIRSKDAEAHLAGRWLIELTELEALGKADAAVLKSFLTRQVGRFRPPYERHEIEQPRQTVFVGSTNEGAYLKDPTGGRRFLPVRVGEIDLLALEDDRDQLLAEADALYQAGHAWHMTDPETLRLAAEEQAERYESDPWHEAVARYLRTRDQVTVGEIMREALEIETPRLDRRGQNRVRAILLTLGWKQLPQGSGGIRLWRAPS